MNSVKAVLLDFNGTMFFDSEFHAMAWDKIYVNLNGDVENRPDSNFYRGPRNDDILKKIGPWLTKEERNTYSKKKEVYYRQICKENPDIVHLSPGTIEFLDFLKGTDIQYAIVSSSIKDNVDFYFEQFNLSNWFDAEHVVYDDGSFSDKTEMYKEAAKRMKVNLSECLVVEDSLTAIRHAKACEIGCIVGIGTETNIEDMYLAGIDHHMNDFNEFDKKWLE